MVMETLPQGTVLYGHYRIERALGSGGFGHVYLSVDLRTNQQYAIKEYLVAGASGKAQLEHEARVLSQLHHPNLPAFQDAFDERGRYYIVLSYIEGSDLTDFIRRVRQRNEVVPLVRIMTWIISICDAVTFLHGLPDLPSLQEQLANNPSETGPEHGAARQFRLGVTKPAKPAPRHSKHLAQLGTLPPELLEHLNAIITQAMAMKPKDRYQSV